LLASFAPDVVRAELIGATLEISGGNCRFPDAAYGNVSRQHLVVWADYSGSVRVWGRLLRGDGSAVGAPFPISDASFASLFPAVAFNPADNEFLVTWDDGGDRGGVIFGQRVRGSDGALLGGNFAIGSVYGGIRSAVAWSATSASWLVVFWGPGTGEHGGGNLRPACERQRCAARCELHHFERRVFFRLPGNRVGGVG
jgi:hypothetical protein